MKKILILDICDTLYSSNTTFDFLEFFSKENKLLKILLNFRKNIFFKGLNKVFLKILKKDLIKTLYIYCLKRKSEEEIEIKALEFYEKVLKKKYKIEVLKKLEKYKSEKFEIVIISGTLEFVAKVIARKNNIDKYFATKLEVKNNLYTGKIERDLLLEKEVILKQILNNNIYKDIHLMTDNITDFNLIKYTQKSIIILNNKNSKFWKSNKNSKVEFLEVKNG